MRNMDVTLVPPAKLSQITLFVKGDLFLNNLKGDISWILSNISCSNLNIDNMSINATDTKTLVYALIHNVKNLELGWQGMVTLDVEDVTHYDGKGKCEVIWCYNDTGCQYREKLSRLAKKINWIVKEGENGSVMIARK